MAFAGDLTEAEFEQLLDQRGGPAVVVHGGAGTRPDVDPAPYFAGTRRAAEAGLRVLSQGGSALDAAQAAAVMLEDDPIFNAGTGAALTSTGEVELDASCMDGTALRAGASALDCASLSASTSMMRASFRSIQMTACFTMTLLEGVGAF